MIWYKQTKWTTAKKQSYNGNQFDSKFEAAYAMELDARWKAGEIRSWKTHENIPLIVNGFHICDYKVDFTITHKDGSIEYVETKGVAFPVWRLKWKLFEALYSDKAKLTCVQQGKFRMPKAKRIKKQGD